MVPIVSYAQNFEDVMLWRTLGDVQNGRYIDVGAQSPLVDSVSMAFHERGWKGVHAEANPQYAQELREARPGDIVVEAVIGSTYGLADFYVLADTGLSSLDGVLAEVQSASSGRDVQRISIPRATLDDLFALIDGPDVHWLKIDVEGSERDVIEGWNSSWRPWVVVIESVRPDTHEPCHAEWEELMHLRGYALAYADGLNRFYVHTNRIGLMPRFTYPPNVFDEFRFSGTASATFCGLVQSRLEQAIGVEDSVRSELEEAAVRLREANERIETLSSAGDAAKSELQEAAVRLREANERIEALSSAGDAARSELQEAAVQLGEANARIGVLSAEAAQRDVLQAEAVELEAERRRVVDDLVCDLRRNAKTIQQSMDGLQVVSLEATRNSRHLAAEQSRLSKQLFQAEAALISLRTEVASIRDRLRHSESERRALAELLQEYDGARARAQQSLADLQASTSWRITAPIRVLKTLLRGDLMDARVRLARGIGALPQHSFARRLLRRMLPAGSRLGNFSRAGLRGVDEQAGAAAISPIPQPLREQNLTRLLVGAGVVRKE